jgi:hypothetical protein
MEASISKQHRSVHVLIYVSAMVFIAILQLTGWMEASIKTLHMWQTLIYVVVIGLCYRRMIAGYGAGIGIATFWNVGNLFVTTFIRSGWSTLVHLIRRGSDPHPELIVAPIAAAAHFVLIGACITAYVLRPKKDRFDLLIVVVSAIVAVFAFFLMIRTWGPQYLHIFWTMLGWVGIHVNA